MMRTYQRVMETFTLKDIPDLDVCVLAALELFSETRTLHVPGMPFKKPLIIGSGNALSTGKIIFKEHEAAFADENTYEEKLKTIKNIDGVIVLSSSGGKHAPLMVKAAQKKRKKTILLTNNPHSEAGECLEANDVFVFPKNREPYTYNTSTYLGMILGKTQEDPAKILHFIKARVMNLMKQKTPGLQGYNAFYFIFPPQFELMTGMVDKKVVELFGRRVSCTVSSSEFIKHATTIVERPDELFISFGYDNKIWGKQRLNVPLPKDAGYAAVMAISYYLIGHIQKTRPAWFKRNIAPYCARISRILRQEIRPIVE